jgi:hypothetical protein
MAIASIRCSSRRLRGVIKALSRLRLTPPPCFGECDTPSSPLAPPPLVLAPRVVDGLDAEQRSAVEAPIGIAVWVLVTRVVADERPETTGGQLDVPGATLVTVALMLAVYGVVGGNDADWTSTRTLGILAGAIVLLVAYVPGLVLWLPRMLQ